jgi:Mg2+ and Co2+ transporter CorA
MLTRLRLAELFTPSAGTFQFLQDASGRSLSRIYVCDYNACECPPPLYFESLDTAPSAETLKQCGFEVLPIQDEDFFFGQRRRLKYSDVGYRRSPGNIKQKSKSNDGASEEDRHGHWRSTVGSESHNRDVRWIHVDGTSGLDRMTLLRLAVKYHLHPLAVDDIIDNRTPTKLDRYADHNFVSLDILTLAGETSVEGSAQRVRINRSNVSIFLSNSRDTLLTILQDRPDQSSWLAEWWSEPDLKFIPNWSMWTKIFKEVGKDPPRRVREMRADYLLYLILDRVADQLRPIAEAYANRLGFMHQHDLRVFKLEWLNELDEMHLELVDLARSIRPMKQVLHHLVKEYEEKVGEERMCLEDVEDAIDQMLGDLEQLKQMGSSLEEAHEAHSDRQMNATLFHLSIAGSIFLPAQFITGIYGMNFVSDDGTPDMPELKWEYGYIAFWGLEAVVLFGGLGCTGLMYYLRSKGTSVRDICMMCLRCQRRRSK